MNKTSNEPVIVPAYKTVLFCAVLLVCLALMNLWFDFLFIIYKQLSPLR